VSRLLRRSLSAGHRLTLAALDTLAAVLAALASREILVWLGVLSLLLAVRSAWLETPLQGVIRGYAYPVTGAVSPAAGLANSPRLLSYALVPLLAVAVTLAGRRWAGWRRGQRHAGTLAVATAAWFATALACRHLALLDALVEQAQERAAMRAFAVTLDNYLGTAPELVLAGTATLLDRVVTAFQLIGYGWWFALLGGLVLIATGPVVRRRGAAAAAVAGWVAIIAIGMGAIAAPAARAEYARLRGEALYAAGHYGEALDRFQAAAARTRALRENPAFQTQLGATLFWLGDRESPPARLFVAQNLRTHGEHDRAELQLSLALAADPHHRLVRRRLAELYADRGVEEFARAELRERTAVWERALAVDGSLLRVLYFLGHAYHRLDGADQMRAVGHIHELMGRVRHAVAVSDLYALLGDCYFKARQDVEARRMYRRALRTLPLVGHMNLRAQRGLLGL
jgi:tetratricopeptide (TPR) repeat protein